MLNFEKFGRVLFYVTILPALFYYAWQGIKAIFNLCMPSNPSATPHHNSESKVETPANCTSELDDGYDSFVPEKPTANSYQLFIKGLTGVTETIDVEPSDTVDTVKKKFFKQTGTKNPRFIFAGKALENDRTLQDYSIQKESTIHCVMRLD